MLSHPDNNEFFIVNMHLFEAKKALVPDTIWLLDQAPGYIAAADITELVVNQVRLR